MLYVIGITLVICFCLRYKYKTFVCAGDTFVDKDGDDVYVLYSGDDEIRYLCIFTNEIKRCSRYYFYTHFDKR